VGHQAAAALDRAAAELIEGVLARVRERGGRVTLARRLLLDAVISSPGHHTADELAATVRARAPGVHLTTIYRNLDELGRMAVVDRTYVGRGPASYGLASAPHGHLVCEECGALADIPDEAFRFLAAAAMTLHGFAIRPAALAAPGRCAACQPRPDRS